MGLFSWATTPKTPFLHTDHYGNQHRFTAEQFGRVCVEWSANVADMEIRQLASYGLRSKDDDILAKIHLDPSFALAHMTALLIAVHATYSVIRLGIANGLFKDVVRGINDAIINESYLLKGHPKNQDYYEYLNSAVGQYCAFILETAGQTSQVNEDRMLFGVGGACRRLHYMLEHNYLHITDKSGSHLEGTPSEHSAYASSSSSETVLSNPTSESDRYVDSLTYLASFIVNLATSVVIGADKNGGLAIAH